MSAGVCACYQGWRGQDCSVAPFRLRGCAAACSATIVHCREKCHDAPGQQGQSLVELDARSSAPRGRVDVYGRRVDAPTAAEIAVCESECATVCMTACELGQLEGAAREEHGKAARNAARRALTEPPSVERVAAHGSAGT